MTSLSIFSASFTALAVALVALVAVAAANLRLRRRCAALEERIEDLADQEWERREADAANRAKSRFIVTVSHEIRTPLNGILGMAELLRDTELTPEQTTYVEAVHSSGDTLLSLIEEMLDFSKIEAGRIELDPYPVTLRTLVEQIVELLAPRAQVKGIEIACFVDDAVPQRVVADVARLRQVLLNLAGNAIKFTETGGVLVTVEPARAGRVGAPAENAADFITVAFRIRDTGIGIAAVDQARIFEEFQQAEGGADRRFGGTGLGLAITKRIVEAMGGTITVESSPGNGSLFSCIVDFAVPAIDIDDGVPPPNLAGTSVLIAAPGAIEAPQLARRLSGWGAKVRLVDSVAAARELTATHSDVVIVDLAFGHADAHQVCGLWTTRAKQRIVLVTPMDRVALASLRAAGSTGYLVKPVRVVSLAQQFGRSAQEIPRPASAGTAAVEAAAGQAGVESGLAVLLAEDSEINALLASNLLTRLGHRPHLTTNGADAVAAFTAAQAGGAPFDLVLMDLRMPGIDGIEAASRMRVAERQAGASRVPIIALTADVLLENREACLAAGMDGILTKPLDRAQLTTVLGERIRTVRAA
jgi:signal transduction histidine kinase/CheY-like chemotaxis protein